MEPIHYHGIEGYFVPLEEKQELDSLIRRQNEIINTILGEGHHE